MLRSECKAMAEGIDPRQGRQFYRALSAVAVSLGALTLSGAALIFFLLPRINPGGYLRNFGVQSNIVTGFSREVRLGGIGRIQQSQAVVMHVQVLSGKLPQDPKWRGIALTNFDGYRWWNTMEVPTLRGVNNSPLDLNLAAPAAFYSGAAPAPSPAKSLR